MPVLAISGHDLPATTKLRATLIHDASKSTTRKRKMSSIITLGMHHAEGQVALTGQTWEDLTTKAETTAGFHEGSTCPLVLIRNGPMHALRLGLAS